MFALLDRTCDSLRRRLTLQRQNRGPLIPTRQPANQPGRHLALHHQTPVVTSDASVPSQLPADQHPNTGAPPVAGRDPVATAVPLAIATIPQPDVQPSSSRTAEAEHDCIPEADGTNKPPGGHQEAQEAGPQKTPGGLSQPIRPSVKTASALRRSAQGKPSRTKQKRTKRTSKDTKDQSGKRMPRLPADIIRLICLMAQTPLPVENGHGGIASADRNQGSGLLSMEQRTLATMLRVSRTFYAIAAPILYREIITDNLPSIVLYADRSRPPARGVLSKRQLFALTRHLHFETPRSIMGLQYVLYGHVLRDTPICNHDHCEAEADKLVKAVHDMNAFTAQGGLRALCPNLDSVSVSAYSTPRGALHLLLQHRLYAPPVASSLQEVWRRLKMTDPSPFHCHPQVERAPFYRSRPSSGSGFDSRAGSITVMEYRGAMMRNGRRIEVEPASFYHVTEPAGPDLGVDWPWPWGAGLGLCFPTVYLYSPPLSQLPVEPAQLFDQFVQQADWIVREIKARRKENPEWYVDIEVRIPRAVLPLFYAFTCPTAIDPLVGDTLKRIQELYIEHADMAGSKLDRWEIVIEEGQAKCQVCCCRYDPDSALVWDGERRQGESYEIAALWDE